MPPLLKACLNGSRTRQEHPAIPRTPDELAADGRAAVEAGAKILHLHPYDATGAETLAAEPFQGLLCPSRICPSRSDSANICTASVVERRTTVW
ncbi:MAG: 3-keto-5-aminohexanoate cleavage protein [Actinomycetota bacterium]|nr:3-keto-5-aminohexanoate cleavage protein [Actinomycetota bacterium]